MLTFIYADLQPLPPYLYQKPLLVKIKKCFPEVNSLDVDASSNEFLILQACRLLEQPDRCGLYFHSPDPEIALGATIRLAEVLIRRQQKSLVILQGEHRRLERLLTNRPQFTFLKNPEEQLLFQYLEDFYK